MKKNDILWVDLTKVVATFAVVWLHSVALILYRYNDVPAMDWWAGNIYDSMVRMSVPLFFMLSGYLLLDKKESIKDFFFKRINKVVVPLMIWSFFYILWNQYYEHRGELSFASFGSTFLTPAYHHLWFLYVIIGLYLYVPILRIFVQNSTKETMYYFVVLWFFAVSAIPLIEMTTHIGSMIDLKMISGYVGYLVMGSLLGKIKLDRKYFALSLVVALTCVLIIATGTYLLTAQNKGGFVGYFYEYLSPTVILLAASVFVLLKYVAEEATVFKYGSTITIIKTLSAASLGIYFIHPMILIILEKGDLGFFLSVFSTKAIYSVPLTATVTFCLSFAVIFVVQKIPLIRKCVP